MTKVADSHLILLPGMLNDASVWQYQRPVLQSKVQLTVHEYGVHSDIGLYAEEVLAQAPSSFALAGFSMGGYIALEILRRAPDRVRGLALISTNSRADDDAQRSMREATIASVESGGFNEVVSKVIAAALYPKAANVEVCREIIQQMAKAIGPEAFCAQLRAVSNRRDNCALLRQLKVPCLLAVGERDRVTPPELTRLMAADIPSADCELIHASGHMLPLQAPELLNAALLRWLEGL